MASLCRRLVAIASILVACLIATSAPAAADARQDATQAIGSGDGAAAARIIAASGLAGKPDVLGRIIYDAGVIAVRSHLGDEFSVAVAEAFVDGGVTWTNANRAFVHAGLLVTVNAPYDEQLLAELGPGGAAIVRTELAYAGIYLPSLPLLQQCGRESASREAHVWPPASSPKLTSARSRF